MNEQTELKLMRYAWSNPQFTTYEFRTYFGYTRGQAYNNLNILIANKLLEAETIEGTKGAYQYTPLVSQADYIKAKTMDDINTLGGYITNNPDRYEVIEDKGNHKIAIYGYYHSVDAKDSLFKRKIKRRYTDRHGHKVIVI